MSNAFWTRTIYVAAAVVAPMMIADAWAQQPQVRLAKRVASSASVAQAHGELKILAPPPPFSPEEVTPDRLTNETVAPPLNAGSWQVESGFVDSAMGPPVNRQHQPILCPQCGRRIRLHGREDFKEYTYREPSPFGVATRNFLNTQIANGEAELLVIRRGYFVDGTDTLTPYGRQRLNRMLPLLPRTPYPIIIEASAIESELDDARALAIQRALASSPFPVPPERIVVGEGRSRPLDGVDAEIVHDNLRLLMEARGTPPPPAFTAIGR